MARRILALDIGSSSLKAALIESTLRRCRIVGLFQQERNPEHSLTEQLRAFRVNHSLQADTILSCVPGDAVSLRFLELPFTRTRQIEQIAPLEFISQIPFDLDMVMVDFHIGQRAAEHTVVLAVAIPKTTLSEHLDALTAAGFDPTAIGLASLAPLALVQLAGADLTGATAVLDIGVSRTSISLLHDGVLRGLRTFNIGLERVAGFPTLMRDLRWTMLASGGDAPLMPERFFLCGDGSGNARVRTELQQATGVEIIPFHEFFLSSTLDTLQQEQGIYATCLGLGLREALGLTTPTVNLRQGAFAHQGQREAHRQERTRLGWLAAGVGVAAGLTFMLQMHGLQTQYNALRQEIRQVFTATLPEVRTIVSEKAQLRDAVEALQGRQRLLQGSATVSPLELLRQLSAALPEQVSLDVDEWNFDLNVIQLRGSTASFDAAETIKSTASGLNLFRDVQLKDVKTLTGGKKVAFSLQLTLGKQTAESRSETP